MSLVRFVSRALLASYFVWDGVDAIMKPESRVADAEPVAEKVLGLAERWLPAEVARRLPAKTETLVRWHGAIEAAGAVMLATGLFRRTGAVIVAVTQIPKAVMAQPRLQQGSPGAFVTELGLLGGALVAAGDTQGRPNLAWLAAQKQRSAKRAAKTATTRRCCAKRAPKVPTAHHA